MRYLVQQQPMAAIRSYADNGRALLGNALQAVDGRPERLVKLRTGPAGAPWMGQIALVVEDAGAGIAGEHLDRIFDAFFTTRICKAIAGDFDTR